MRRQTYGYLPSHTASLTFGWYQFILLGDRSTCVNDLPKVVSWKRTGQESNRNLLSRKSNVLIITPPDTSELTHNIARLYQSKFPTDYVTLAHPSGVLPSAPSGNSCVSSERSRRFLCIKYTSKCTHKCIRQRFKGLAQTQEIRIKCSSLQKIRKTKHNQTQAKSIFRSG